MKYTRKKDIVARTVAGENLLVPIKECTKKVFTLNNVGLHLWECIESERTEDELADSLVDRYGVSVEVALKDTRAFLSDMTRLNLVAEI
jgi:hypothetical protein